MFRVDWSGSLRIHPKSGATEELKHASWVSLCAPKSSKEICGNREQVSLISQWFQDLPKKSSCNSLFVFGAPGVWKSTTIRVLAREHGFHTIETFSDTVRNTKLLNSKIQELSMFPKAVLVLDDFETFIEEPSAIKWVRKVVKNPNVFLVMISSTTFSGFSGIMNSSLCVKFYPYTTSQTNREMNRLSQIVKTEANLPPMDAFFIAATSDGNIVQTINQVQMYYRTRPRSSLNYNQIFERNADVDVKNVPLGSLLAAKNRSKMIYSMGTDALQNTLEAVAKTYVDSSVDTDMMVFEAACEISSAFSTTHDIKEIYTSSLLTIIQQMPQLVHTKRKKRKYPRLKSAGLTETRQLEASSSRILHRTDSVL